MTGFPHSYTTEDGHVWTMAELLADLDRGDYLYLTPKMCADLARHLRSGPLGGKWISTSDHLPEAGADVLAYWTPKAPGGEVACDVVTFAHEGHWHDPEDDEDDYRAPDFWMPLPNPPSATQQSPSKEKP